MDNVHDVLSTLNRNQSADIIQGKIQSINGSNALVRLNGSGRTQEAWYNKNSNLAPGDDCVLVRTNKNGRWVVMAGFNTSYGGHNDITPPPTDGTGIINITGKPKDRYTSGAPSFTFGGISNWTVAFRQQVEIYRAGVLLAGWTGYANTNGGAIGNYGVRMLIDGDTIICNDQKCTVTNTAATLYAPLSIIGITSGLSRGGHELQVEVFSTGQNPGALVQSSLFAVELF